MRLDENAYIQHIKAHNCDWCGAPGPSEFHHQGPHPLGRKGSDWRGNALCLHCHRKYHDTAMLGSMSAPQTKEFLAERAFNHLISYLETEDA